MPKRVGGAALTALSALAAVTATVMLSGCSSPEASTPSPPVDPDDDRPLVLTTFTVLADIARNVAGDVLRVESITKAGAEIHGYEPTPGDMRRAADAALILDNGLGLEGWFAQFVAATDAPHVVVSAEVEPIDISGGAYQGTPNPHAWMSPANGALYVEVIVEAFTDLAPAHAAEFAANGDAYRAALGELHDELTDAVADLPVAHRVLVTCEGAFSYLARDAGLDEAYIWPVNAEQQATPRRLAATIDVVREREVPAVFCESTVSDKAMRQVVADSDAAFGGVLYVDSLSTDDGPVPTYLDLLRHDVAVITAGLGGERGGASEGASAGELDGEEAVG